MYPQPARCMHAKSSVTTAFTKLGCSYTDKKCPLYMSIKLSKLMLDPLCSNPCRVAFTPYSWHALSMCLLRSLWPALIIVNRSIETSEGQNVSTKKSTSINQSWSEYSCNAACPRETNPILIITKNRLRCKLEIVFRIWPIYCFLEKKENLRKFSQWSLVASCGTFTFSPTWHYVEIFFLGS